MIPYSLYFILFFSFSSSFSHFRYPSSEGKTLLENNVNFVSTHAYILHTSTNFLFSSFSKISVYDHVYLLSTSAEQFSSKRAGPASNNFPFSCSTFRVKACTSFRLTFIFKTNIIRIIEKSSFFFFS